MKKRNDWQQFYRDQTGGRNDEGRMVRRASEVSTNSACGNVREKAESSAPIQVGDSGTVEDGNALRREKRG
ncbi:hypothetical protein [Kiloniella majae]|uniref:hypothetical protein n=1 Tax=Kiloniella majae TaxID=1938558 RepID=UPI000F792AFC|nr:hypothetical protein [Kiloniella majae]